jgi:hypothetical protein
MDSLLRWLTGLGLERYAPLSAENNADREALCLLIDAELEKQGFTPIAA